MKKNNYVITGISREQAYLWKENIRDDVKLYEADGSIIPVIELSKWEALKMKIQIIRNNMKHRYGFGLARI